MLRVEVTIQRKAENKTKATKMRSGTKLRDILKLYPEKKAMALVKKLKEKGMYHFDEDFPGDEEEIFYYVGGGNTLKNENITTTSAKVEIKDNNKDLTNVLICDGGALQSGALPGLEVRRQNRRLWWSQGLIRFTTKSQFFKRSLKKKTVLNQTWHLIVRSHTGKLEYLSGSHIWIQLQIQRYSKGWFTKTSF